MSEYKLGEIFGCKAVKNFGMILRKMLRPPTEGGKERWSADYASLVEMEYVETKEQFTETIKKFLRRYEVIARKHGLKRVGEHDLEELMGLVDKYGVKPIRAALISYALVKSEKEDEAEFEGGDEI